MKMIAYKKNQPSNDEHLNLILNREWTKFLQSNNLCFIKLFVIKLQKLNYFLWKY